MIPPFDDFGLLPAGVHECTLAEAAEYLVFNDHRQLLWANLIHFLTELREADMAYPIFLAGGFASAKTLPDDIDVVHDLTHASELNQYRGWRLFDKGRDTIKAAHRVDYCVNLPGNNDFSAYFQYVGPKVAVATGMKEKDPRGVLYIRGRSWLDGLNK